MTWSIKRENLQQGCAECSVSHMVEDSYTLGCLGGWGGEMASLGLVWAIQWVQGLPELHSKTLTPKKKLSKEKKRKEGKRKEERKEWALHIHFGHRGLAGLSNLSSSCKSQLGFSFALHVMGSDLHVLDFQKPWPPTSISLLQTDAVTTQATW